MSYLKSAPSNLWNCEISWKKWKCLNLGLKVSYLGILGLEFNKAIVIFEISTLKFLTLRNFMKKWKCLIWEKNALFGYFSAWIFKSYCYIWNLHPQICQIAKFCVKMKMLKFGNKNVLFEYFRVGFWKQYFHIWFQYPGICLIESLWNNEYT